MLSPQTGAAAKCDVYDVGITITHPNLHLGFPAVPIVECQPLSPDYECLLGRDILAFCLLVYDGLAGRFSLAY